MKNADRGPETLLEAVRYFADQDVALAFVRDLRWPDGVTCPHCGAGDPLFLKTRKIWKCRACRKQFSVKVGTIFEDSPLGLDKWLPALWMLANCKNGISSYELHRALGITQKSAWFMLHRIRLAMQAKSFRRYPGIVEIDETMIGGLVPNMHRAKRERIMGDHKSGSRGKVGVVAGVRRGKKGQASQVRAYVMADPHARPHARLADEMVTPGSKVYTDTVSLYKGALKRYQREMVNHTEKEFVRGEVHTNSVENFWTLLKRSIKGTYVAIDPFHLLAYLDEQVFRFNERKGNDGDRFIEVVKRIIGRRLQYRELIGADLDPATT